MSDETRINDDLNSAINNNDHIQNGTKINSVLAQSTLLDNDAIVLGEYRIINRMNLVTGEADLYICEKSQKLYVAKIYRRAFSIKEDVLKALKEIDSPYIASICASGEINDRSITIQPYYADGSLQGKTFSFEELKKVIIPQVNEALKALHDVKLIHKDLKPSNIMRRDDGGIAIIDFGISSVQSNGSTVLVTTTGMTPDYAAPESFRGLYLEESDYYSFGVTLYELFCGHTPYSNMSDDEIARYITVQQIPMPENMPDELKSLISALTYNDITKRGERDNPNRRWTYEEVKAWCESNPPPVSGEASVISSIPVYKFLGNGYTDIHKLTLDWEDGKKQLFRGLLSGFFKSFDPEIAGRCLDAEEEAQAPKCDTDVIFIKTLYEICPELTEFCWRGKVFHSLAKLGDELLEVLRKNDSSVYYEVLLKKSILSFYSKTVLRDKQLAGGLKALEDAAKTSKKDARENIIRLFTLGYLLSNERNLVIDGEEFADIDALIDKMQAQMDKGYEFFEDFCGKLIKRDSTLDLQFEAWLIAIGKREQLDNWKNFN